MVDLSRSMQAQVQARLRSGERVVWSASPRPARIARQAWPYVVFGFVWLAVVLGGWAASGGARERTPVMLGLSFPGVAALTMPLWFARAAARTAYVLTDRRAIVIEPRSVLASMWVTRSFASGELANAEALINTDGSGDLILGSRFAKPRVRGKEQRAILLGFFGIADVANVAAMARRIATERPTTP